MKAGLVAKEIVSVVVAVVLVVLLSVPLGPLPPVGGLLNPNGGVWTVAGHAGFPARQDLAVPGLDGTVTVLRDAYGVPHIFATSNHDLFFALGFVHAQDRIWQMDIQYRLAAGRLAEVLGPGRVASDAFLRTVGLGRNAAAYLAGLPADDPGLVALTAYSAGVNAWIGRATTADLPLEYRLLGYAPEPWDPLHSLTIGSLLAYGLSADFTDVELGLLADDLGAAAVDALFPVNATYPVPIVPATRGGGGTVVDPEAARDVLGKARLVEPFVGAFREGLGSNNWVVAANRSATGRPILAGDPHLRFQLPAIWYEAQLTGGDYDVYGVTLPGVPGVIIGFNRFAAWSETNTGADVTDFYREVTSPAHPGAYLFQGQWRPFQVVNETVRVKGGRDVVVAVKITVHGPVVTERGEDLSMRWTGNRSGTSINAVLAYMKARTWTEFRDALRMWHNPAQNFAFASWGGPSASTIAIRSNGDYPIRSNTLGRVPLNGSGSFEWTGFVPFGEEPEAVDPAQGFLSSTNQVPAVPPAMTHYLGWLWDPGYRSRRINGLLRDAIATDGSVSFRDMQDFQNDVLDTAAQAFLPYLLNATALTCATPPASDVCPARHEIGAWDYRMTTDSVAATVWHEFIYHYLNETFGDEWARAGATGLLFPYPDVLERLTRDAPASPWFDDVRTPRTEARDDILARALADAVAVLRRLHGPLGPAWEWGAVHARSFPHLTGLRELSRGPYGSPGDEVTLNRGGGSSAVSGDVVSTGGPSWRMVVDVGNPGASAAVFPGGESGNPLSPHYDDQLVLWLRGEYKDIEFPWNPQLPAGRLESTLVLRRA